jgi:DhnA family fructose-bisphosphate aldolase class Ia
MSETQRRLDRKLSSIREGRYRSSDFIIADAKDGDMSGGVSASGPEHDATGVPTGRMNTSSVYRAAMKEMIASGLIDIMLTSLSSAEALVADGAFEGSDITPAVRLNDATDIWAQRGASYREHAARPFRTARIDRAISLCDLGLYAVTFYNDVDRDVATLEAYTSFRDDASAVGMRHFLEVFNPAFNVDTGGVDAGFFVNDAIARCLAGVATPERPLFLKMPYNGARALEELASYDTSRLIVGILGGSAGTTRDTMELVGQAERHGARLALFGRKIYFAEDSPSIVRTMRAVVEGEVSPVEAVKAYHDCLQKKGIQPKRPLEDDLQVTEDVLKPEAA